MARRTSSLSVVVITTALALCPFAVPRLAGAATNPSCATFRGTWTFSPTLPHYGTSAKVSPVSTIVGSLGGCTGGVTSGSVRFSSTKSATGVNCTTFKSYDTVVISGRLTVTWNTRATSTATIGLGKVACRPTRRTVSGTLGRGLFAGDRLTGRFGYTLPRGACTSTGLRSVSVTNAGPFVFVPTGPSR